MADAVTVAIPVRNGGALLGEVLTAVQAQRVDRPLELLVADSGSTDGSRRRVRHHGASLIEVIPTQFSHGATRNRLAERASGSHIAFLTQDAVPADERWLASLLEGFDAGENVGLVFGPYRARPEASLMVRRELDQWFSSLPTDPELRGRRRPRWAALVLHGRERVYFAHRVGASAVSACEIRGGPPTGTRHARRRVRQGLSPRCGRDPLPPVPASRSVPPLVRRVARLARGRGDRRPSAAG